MKKLTAEQFESLIEQARIKPRVKREVRFVASTQDLSDEDWEHAELLPVYDRSKNKGVLVVGLDDQFYAAAFESSRGITSKTGKAQPIICDFCRTWQTGSRSGSVLFPRDRNGSAVGYSCCADLLCSWHVRSLTSAARTSRSQLREDLDDAQRVERLRTRLKEIVERLELSAINL